MTTSFAILSLILLAGAIGAVALRNLIHAVLSLAIAFAGLAGLYLVLGAEFVGLAQLLIYVGAVAILIVFAVLLTRRGEVAEGGRLATAGWAGLGVAALVFGSLAAAVLATPGLRSAGGEPVGITVRAIGEKLMTEYVVPLQVIGLLLTAALIGAVLIAMREPPGGES